MIISEVLDAIDNISSITIESEISMCESLLSSYDKMSIIEENYNGNDINDFKIFQEGFGDDVKDEMKKSGKNMGTLMKILTALPRFIIAIVKSIKNQLTKKTKDNAKEINDNVKKLSDEQKKGLAQLFPKDRKGKIDAKKIITGMIGGAAVTGGVIAIGKFKIPKKLAEQTKHVLGKLKGKKSNNPKTANKKNNAGQNENSSPDSDDKLNDNGGSPVNDDEKFTKVYNLVHKKLNKVIDISINDIKSFVDVFHTLAAKEFGLPELYDAFYNDRIKTAAKNIINNNKNIIKKLETKEGKRLLKTFNDYDDIVPDVIMDQINDTTDEFAGLILSIIQVYVDLELSNNVADNLLEISQVFSDYEKNINSINDKNIKLSSSEFQVHYNNDDESIEVRAKIYNYCFYRLAHAKYYLSHDDSTINNPQADEEIKKLTEEIKKNFGIEKIDYTTGGVARFKTTKYIPIDKFVDELNSYINNTLDPEKINKQIDDITTKINEVKKARASNRNDTDKCDVFMVKSSIKGLQDEILYISNIIKKINELITNLNEFIKKINETNRVNIVTTDKKLTEVDVSAIKGVK